MLLVRSSFLLTMISANFVSIVLIFRAKLKFDVSYKSCCYKKPLLDMVVGITGLIGYSL